MRRFSVRKRKTRVFWNKKRKEHRQRDGARESKPLVVHRTGHSVGAVPGWGPHAATKRNRNTSLLLQVFRIDFSASAKRSFPLVVAPCFSSWMVWCSVSFLHRTRDPLLSHWSCLSLSSRASFGITVSLESRVYRTWSFTGHTDSTRTVNIPSRTRKDGVPLL